MWQPERVTLYSGSSPDWTFDALVDGFMRWLGPEKVRAELVLTEAVTSSEYSAFAPVYAQVRTPRAAWATEDSDFIVISLRDIAKLESHLEGKNFHCPIATIDTRDRPWDAAMILKPFAPIQVAFKCEQPYTAQGTVVYSCPSSLVPEEQPPLKPWAERSIDACFIGGPSNITRAPIAEALKTLPNTRVILGEHIPREEYLALLQDSKIGVACYGAGFNSYRYWEIPYNGCLLVAQPVPLLIPHNFQFGVHGMFYLSPVDLLRAIPWALSHPTEAAVMAQAARDHLMSYHLSTHRAQWMTQIVDAVARKAQADVELQFPF